jgi:hypothetical protein
MDRGQVPLTTVEAALGVLLLASVAFTFVLGVPAGTADRAQLELYADDAATLLASEAPRHADRTRLAEVTASRDAFERERDALRRRVDRLLPDNLLFRVETEYGAVGYPLPAGVETGTATVPTVNGDVTVRVWYA